jgi:hypothetical protein
MRDSDMLRLKHPYRPNSNPDVEFANALGFRTDEVDGLYREVFADLNDKVLGIGWWAPHPGTSRRILISHYLVECIKSISMNLIEAGLHLYEALDYWDKESEFLAGVVSRGPEGRPSVRMPQRKTPKEDLAYRMATMHAVGFFRAAMGALDCLGAATVGVLGLRVDIKHADFGGVQKALKNSNHELHSTFRGSLKGSISDSGPEGWLEWMTQFRNMVVHRARRWHMYELKSASHLYGADGHIIPKTSSVEHLPADPDASQVEALLSGAAAVLTERAEDTLRGSLNSTAALIEAMSRRLLSAWKTRRANPSLVVQPREQWPSGAVTRPPGFLGFRPGSASYDPRAWISNCDMGRQFRTAALDDDLRHLWKTFD